MKFHRTLLFATVLLLTYPSHAASQQEKQEPPAPAAPSQSSGVGQAARAYFDQGMRLLNQRDLDGAIAAFTKAAETDPKFADAIVWRGVARWFKQDLSGALTDYSHAIEIDPNNSQAYFRRALALERTQPERAIADYGKAVELDPTSIGAYINRSNVRKSQGDVKGAIADLDIAIKVQPNDPFAYHNRGILHWETGNRKDALIDLDKSIELQPKGSVAHMIRGFVRASLREFPAAYRDFDRAFQLEPNLRNGRMADPEVVDHYAERGRQLADNGDLDGALLEFNKAIILGGPVGQFPSSQVGSRGKSLAVARGNRGLIWLRKGNETEAQKDLAECLKLDPGTRSWLEDQIRTSGLQFPLNGIPPYQDERRPSAVAAAPPPITVFTPAETATTRPTTTSTLTPAQTAKTSPKPIVRLTPTQTQPPTAIQPIVPTLEQIKNVPSFALGQGYQAVESTIGSLEMAVKYPNIRTIFTIDGKPVTITKENAPGILQAFNERLQVYQQAIEQRGHSNIDGWYILEVNQAIQGKEGFDLVTLFADMELSRHEYILAQELQIKQQDFSIKLVRELDIGGEKKDLSFPGLVIGDSIVFRVPNINTCFYGTLNGNTIELKIDLNELKRSLSFVHAVESITDPAKAAASELNRKRYSEWLVRLKRKPSNKPLEPSPSDQLLIITPDKKLRQVARGEISLK